MINLGNAERYRFINATSKIVQSIINFYVHALHFFSEFIITLKCTYIYAIFQYQVLRKRDLILRLTSILILLWQNFFC